MSTPLYPNNVSTVLAADINATGATAFTVRAGDGAQFGNIPADHHIWVRFGTPALNRRYRATGRNGDTLACDAMDRAWPAGTAIKVTVCSELLDDIRGSAQPLNTLLGILAGLAGGMAADKFIYFTSGTAAAWATVTAQARTFLAATTQTLQRQALGAGAVGEAVFVAADQAAARAAIGAGTGGGDMVGSANLSELTDPAAARAALELDQVDNTADADKPVSTAQAAADAAVLASAQGYADGLVVGLLDPRGNWDASGNTYPDGVPHPSNGDKGGSGPGNAIKEGDLWFLSHAGTLAGRSLAVGTSVRALVDTPGQTDTNWALIAIPVGFVPENIANKSTSVTTDQASDTKYPSVKAVYDWVTGLFSGLGTAATHAHSDYATAAQGAKGEIIEIQAACSDESTALTAGTAKVTFRSPCAITVTAVRASLTTAQSSGSIVTVDINEAGVSILSTKLTIDNTKKTSVTAAIAAVISDPSIADDAEITVDIDQIGDGTAKGLKITIIGTRA